MAMSMPRGSILWIKSNGVYYKVSEHNRSEFTINPQRIEKTQRMSNGSLRKFWIADKKTFSLSWSMLPHSTALTVDGGWGAEDIKNFYESSAGQKDFRIKLNPTVFDPQLVEQLNGVLADDYTYTVMFTSADFTIVKRGLQTYWDVSISLEQV